METKHVKPEKFTQSYRCECFQPRNYCNCPHKAEGSQLYVESVECAVDAIAEVMVICGIPQYIAQKSKNVVFYYFLHFQEKRHRIDTVPRKRIYRLDLMNDLACKCGMTFTQAQTSYSIIKRAFRAFYHGTDEGGVPNPIIMEQLKHLPACLWYHAARRTAQVVASYQGMFTVVQKKIELDIRQVYRKLYEHMKSNMPSPDADHECACEKCYKRIIVETLQGARSISDITATRDTLERIYQKESRRMEELRYRSSLASGRKHKSSDPPIPCNCRSLRKHKDERDIPLLAESTNTGYSQGPFVCSWYPITEESDKEDDAENDVFQELSTEIPCPPCDEDQSDNSSCSSCSCTCESCTCSSERSCSTATGTEAVEEEHELSEQISELEENETRMKHSCCPYSKDTLSSTNAKQPKKIQKPTTLQIKRKRKEGISVTRQFSDYSIHSKIQIEKASRRSTTKNSLHLKSFNNNMKNQNAVKIINSHVSNTNVFKERSIEKKHRETMTEFIPEAPHRKETVTSIIKNIFP